MFDLAAFDAEIDRRRQMDGPGEDTLLTQSLRGPMAETGITAFGKSTSGVLGAFALAGLIVPMIFGTGPSHGTAVSGMSLDQVAVHMNMTQTDPMVISVFQQPFMI